MVSMFIPRLRHMFLLKVLAHVSLAAWPMASLYMPRLRSVSHMCLGGCCQMPRLRIAQMVCSLHFSRPEWVACMLAVRSSRVPKGPGFGDQQWQGTP